MADLMLQFFSEAILARRGPLAKVWLAAHMERKLSKTQTLQTDIEESVGMFLLLFWIAAGKAAENCVRCHHGPGS